MKVRDLKEILRFADENSTVYIDADELRTQIELKSVHIVNYGVVLDGEKEPTLED